MLRYGRISNGCGGGHSSKTGTCDPRTFGEGGVDSGATRNVGDGCRKCSMRPHPPDEAFAEAEIRSELIRVAIETTTCQARRFLQCSFCNTKSSSSTEKQLQVDYQAFAVTFYPHQPQQPSPFPRLAASRPIPRECTTVQGLWFLRSRGRFTTPTLHRTNPTVTIDIQPGF